MIDEIAVNEMITENALIREVLTLMVEYDTRDDLDWSIRGERIVLYIRCNDFFHWATADLEEITKENVETLREAYSASVDFGGLLFCARSRKMRPQLPFYAIIPAELHPLFNAVGPEREVDFFNPDLKAEDFIPM